DLENKFGEVGFRYFDAERFEHVIQANFFRGHAFGFDHQAHGVLLAYFADVMRGLPRILREKKVAAVAAHAGLELSNELRLIAERAFFNGSRLLFQKPTIKIKQSRQGLKLFFS
ncbi:MAG TPA: hypothetical protein VJ571_08600, partial [Candidatus Nitrosotalea sp.]|nr:hypothetical protein [Candidatus Nitrosotalea sp.]